MSFTRGYGALEAETAPQPVNAPIATKMENQPKSPDEIEARRLAAIIQDLGKQAQAVGLDLKSRYPEGSKIDDYARAGDFKSASALMNKLIPAIQRDIKIKKTINAVTTDQAITGLPNGVLVAGGAIAAVGIAMVATRKK